MSSVVESSSCMACRSPIDGGFCGECGGPGPQLLRQWEAQSLGYSEDGVLDEDEYFRLMDSLSRQGYSKDNKTHKAALVALLSELGIRLGPAPVQLQLDEEAVTDLVVGKRADLEFELSNLEANLKTGVRLVWRTGLEKDNKSSEYTLKALGPNQKLRVPFPSSVVPSHSGRYTVSGILELDDQTPFGRVRRLRYSFEQPVKVGEAAGAGPQNLSVNVDASSMRVTADPLVNLGVTPISRGGLATEVRWHPLKLVPLGAGDAVRRKLKAGVPVLNAFGVPVSAANPADGVRKLFVTGPSGEFEFVATPMPTLRMGRDPARCDVRLAVEPFMPPERYPDNVSRSFRVSGQHLSITVERSEVRVVDMGSSGGTFVGGRKLNPNEPVALSEEPISVRVADALELSAQAILGMEGSAAGALVRRLNNVTNRQYVVVTSAVGFDACAAQPICSAERAPLVLVSANGKLALGNLSTEGIDLGGRRVGPGRYTPLCRGDSFTFEDATIRIE